MYDVHDDVVGLRVGGVAGVAAGVLRGGAMDEDPGGGGGRPVLRDHRDAAAGGIVGEGLRGGSRG